MKRVRFFMYRVLWGSVTCLVALFTVGSSNGADLAKKNYTRIDNYVYRTPAEAEKTMDNLVHYLSQPIMGFSKEESVARAIYIWIVSNIRYDYYNYKHIENKQKKQNYNDALFDHDIFNTRIGVCRGIAGLYAELATKAGLKVKYIRGTSFQEKHAWNAVSIDGKWCLLDATWDLKTNDSLKKIKTDYQYQKEVQKQLDKNPQQKKKTVSAHQKRVKTEWYCLSPRSFAKTHHPLNKADELLK